MENNLKNNHIKMHEPHAQCTRNAISNISFSKTNLGSMTKKESVRNCSKFKPIQMEEITGVTNMLGGD